MSERSDLLFLIMEAKKSSIKNPKSNRHGILIKFNRFKEEHLDTIKNKVKLKFDVEPSRSALLNADMKYDEKFDRVKLYVRVSKIGEIVIIFDSRFSIIDIHK